MREVKPPNPGNDQMNPVRDCEYTGIEENIDNTPQKV